MGALLIGLVGMLLLARRDEAGIVAEWRELRTQEQAGLQQGLDARVKMHRSAMRWLRSRARDAEAAGAIITAADLKQGQLDYERETLAERRMLRRFRRMLRARR